MSVSPSTSRLEGLDDLTFQKADDPVFLDAALEYPESVFMAAEALRYVPDFLAP